MVLSEQPKPKLQYSSAAPSVVPNNPSMPPSPTDKTIIFNPSSSPQPSTAHQNVMKRDNIDHDADDDENYFNSFPPGFRFCPRDHELVMSYLQNKLKGLRLPRNRIVDVTLYQHNPEELAEAYQHYGEEEWYFFTPRDKKYKNGTRPSRSAGGGYWKATGADKEIKHNGVVVGYKKALVYYIGKAPKGDKTNWIMHEFRVADPPAVPMIRNNSNGMRLDEWVLCKIFRKTKRNANVGNQPNWRKHSAQPHLQASINGECNSGTDSLESANTFNGKQQANCLGRSPDAVPFSNSYSAAQQVLGLSETYGNPVKVFPCSVYPKVYQDELWTPPRHFYDDLADTFCYYDSIEDFPSNPSNISPTNPASSAPAASATNSMPNLPDNYLRNAND